MANGGISILHQEDEVEYNGTFSEMLNDFDNDDDVGRIVKVLRELAKIFVAVIDLDTISFDYFEATDDVREICVAARDES